MGGREAREYTSEAQRIFCANIDKYARLKGYTIQALRANLNLRAKIFFEIKNNLTRLRKPFVTRISEFLGIPSEWFFMLDSPDIPQERAKFIGYGADTINKLADAAGNKAEPKPTDKPWWQGGTGNTDQCPISKKLCARCIHGTPPTISDYQCNYFFDTGILPRGHLNDKKCRYFEGKKRGRKSKNETKEIDG